MDHSSLRDESSQRNSKLDNVMGRGQYFGDISYNSLRSGNQRNDCEKKKIIHDRLNNERIKALEALQRSRKSDTFKKPVNNSKSAINVSSKNLSLQLDNSEYVPFRRPNAINISDLVTDETINLESSSSCTPSLSKDVKVSFEPSEMTGRSTLYNVSVNEILASSFAPKARNLCETFQDRDFNERHYRHEMPSSSTLSTIFNGSRSLPRTADMSLSKNTCTEESFNGGFENSFNSAGAGTGGFNESENFAPGELMQSRLVNDEISWAQEYAAIPTAALSEEAKAKALRNCGVIAKNFDSPSTSNSMIAGDANFSVGSFFNMRSENIWNIVKSKSPDKCGSPVALVDEDDNTVATTSTDITPKIDNKTYTLLGTITRPLEKEQPHLPRGSVQLNHVRKDSGNASDSSYILSISAIDRALCNLDIQSNSSCVGVSEQLLKQGKKSKSCMNPNRELDTSKANAALLCSKGKSLGGDTKIKSIEKKIEDEMILENKENLDPKNKRTSMGRVALCDTISFSETLLNSSDMKSLHRSSTQPRSPLSPIIVAAPVIRLNQAEDGEEADNDEWPSTPIINNRRVRRKKSPRDKSPLQNNGPMNDSNDAKTPVNAGRSSTCSLNNKNKSDKEPKSMSSTRIDGEDQSSKTVSDFVVSPNISNSSLVVRSNTLTVPQIGTAQQQVSPNRLDNTPISSPGRYHLSQVNSPTTTTIEFRSPNLDATSNSDRHLLGAGAVRKVLSSPAGSESSSTYSYGTIQSYRSAISGTSGRSVSRCSSCSEFSHRDGKQVPLKVTNTELSWGSTKLRSESIKSMQIKNIANKRFVIRFEVSGPGFQIANSQRSNTLTLHSRECRTISISFCPTVCGVAIGKLSLYPPCGATTINNTSFLDVPLYGYGGNASIIAQNVSLGPVGAPFVTMGDVCELAQPLERTISFYNKGPLVGFAAVTVDTIGLMIPRLSDAFDIQPRRFLIQPGNVANVRIVFRPKREEIKKLIKKKSMVQTLANVKVVCGDEANRQRICRLLSQMSEDERSKLSPTAWDLLWTTFPQQTEIPELPSIKENASVAMDLGSYCRIHEILLTIRHDNLNDTFESSELFADIDETVLFRTICTGADSPTPSNLGTIDEYEEESLQSVSKSTKHDSWSVSPQKLSINLTKQVPVTLRVYNRFKSRQFFEVVCNLKGMFQFTPSDGYVAPDGGQTDINITLNANFKCSSESVFIMVYMENERIMVPVNIMK